MVSKFYNGIHDPKEQENEIYALVEMEDWETFYRHHTIPLTSQLLWSQIWAVTRGFQQCGILTDVD